MLHGDLVTITREGILVREKAVQDLGIYDNSQCWGVWIENPVKNRALCKDRVRDHRHLVVSPFHPSSWPFLLRVQLWLRDEQGAMDKACTLLRRCGLSILFAECAPSGFTHATWTVIAEVMPPDDDANGCDPGTGEHQRATPPEATETSHRVEVFRDLRSKLDLLRRLRTEKHDLDLEKRFRGVRTPEGVTDDRVPSGADFERVRDLSSRVAAWMLGYAAWTRDKLKRETSAGAAFENLLFDWSKKSPFMLDEETLIKQISSTWPGETGSDAKHWARKQQSKAFPPSIDVQWIPALSFFAFSGAQMFDPMSLRYRARAACLALSRGERIDLPDYQLRQLPMSAMASFSDRFKYIRIDPITPDRLNHELTLISVDYETRATLPGEPRHSMGLLGEIARALSQRDVDLLHISNKWTEYRNTSEAGRVVLVADAPPDQYSEIENSIRCLRSCQDPSGTNQLAEQVDLTNVTASRYPTRRLFLSLHFGHPREQKILTDTKRIAEDHGFDLRVVRTHIDDASQLVHDELAASDAVLQILSFRSDESPETTEFPWLDYEFGLADGLKIPAIRMVDIVRADVDWWSRKIRTKRGLPLKQFRSDLTDAQLCDAIREAVGELAAWLISHGH